MCTMPCPPGWRVLPWATVLLLSGIQHQVTHAWCSEEDLSGYQQDPELPAAVRLAQDTFNRQSQNKYAYRLVRVLSSQREQVGAAPGLARVGASTCPDAAQVPAWAE